MGSFDNSVVQLLVVIGQGPFTIFAVFYSSPDRIGQTSICSTLVLGGDFNFPKSALEWHKILVPAVP